jgi:hypothetical protein
MATKKGCCRTTTELFEAFHVGEEDGVEVRGDGVTGAERAEQGERLVAV